MRQRSARAAAAILVFVMVLALTTAAMASSGSGNVAAEARSGVVRILTRGPDGSYALGSGFGVGKAGKETDIFITNHHVVNSYYYDDNGGIVAYPAINVWILKNSNAWNPVTGPDTSQCIPCEVIYSQDGGYPDIAVIRAAETPSGRVALPLQDDEDSLHEGNQVYVLGYPGTSDMLEQGVYGERVVAGVEDVTITSGVVSRFTTSSTFGNTRVIQHDASINHGNSGGPLIDSNGAVVGINTYSLGMDPNSYNDNINVSVRIKYVKDVLDDLNIPYDVYKAGFSLSPVMIGVLVAAAVVVIAIIVIVAVLRKPKQAAVQYGQPGQPQGPVQYGQPGQPQGPVQYGHPVQPQAPAQYGQPGQPQGPAQYGQPVQPQGPAQYGQPVQPQGPAQYGQPAQPQAPAQYGQPVQPQGPAQAAAVIAGDTGLRVQGVSGHFAGRRFAIAGKLRIGRDPARNDLVYPADSQGVSGAHCVLIVEGGRLLLQDLGSTYGTFTGGNRLAANAPVELRVGDRFYLGSERETFVVARKGEV